MTTLHTINKRCADLDIILPENDAIIFIEDGVYNCLTDAYSQLLDTWMPSMVYVLQADAIARGLGKDTLAVDAGITQVDHLQFVHLCTKYDNVINWF